MRAVYLIAIKNASDNGESERISISHSWAGIQSGEGEKNVYVQSVPFRVVRAKLGLLPRVTGHPPLNQRCSAAVLVLSLFLPTASKGARPARVAFS